jgi:hypothetical protein
MDSRRYYTVYTIYTYMIIVTHNIDGRISVMTIIADKKNNMVELRPQDETKVTCWIYYLKNTLFWGTQVVSQNKTEWTLITNYMGSIGQ